MIERLLFALGIVRERKEEGSTFIRQKDDSAVVVAPTCCGMGTCRGAGNGPCCKGADNGPCCRDRVPTVA